MVSVAQLVERLTVAQVVVGSIPIAHPRFQEGAESPFSAFIAPGIIVRGYLFMGDTMTMRAG
jgi:hypothetical protein